MNQLMLTWKHIVYQYIFTVFYAMVTAIWQISTNDAIIFPELLDWVCKSRTEVEGCLSAHCLLWFFYFAIVQTCCFSVILFLHYLKSKYCCRRSVDIITYEETQASQLGSITAKRD